MNTAAKALKIIKRLEKITSSDKSNFQVVRKEGKIIFEKNENQVLIQIIHLILFIGPWAVVYFQENEQILITKVILIISSLIILLSYYKGSF